MKALEEFQAEYGYALRPEDIVDNGYYNSSFRVPTRQYRDYMDFIQRFVAEKARELDVYKRQVLMRSVQSSVQTLN